MIRDLLAVAVRAALEWGLASLLLANGAAFCLIAAAAAGLRLAPPCILCARVHRLLCFPSASDSDALCRLLCHAHLAAAAATPDHGERDAVGATKNDADDREDKLSGLETHRVVSIGSEICEQDDEQRHRTRDTDDGAGGSDDPLVSLFELAPIVARPLEGDAKVSLHQSAAASDSDDLLAVDGDERLSVARLASALRAQRQEMDALRALLAAERRERAEAEEYQRQLEEQGELDREAARLAMQMVHEAESEKHGLQRQLDACRVRAQLRDGGQDAAGEANGDGDNNYQSLVDFLPGSVYSSSPDLANLLKLYTDNGNGDRRQRDGYASAVAEVADEPEKHKVTAGPKFVDSLQTFAESLQTVTEAE